MPVKLLATNPFAEPARLEYEPSPSPAMRTCRWKRPLGVLPQHLKPTATAGNTRRTSGPSTGRSHGQERPQDVRQLFSMTQAATEHLKAATQQGQGNREQTKSCELDAYRIGTPSYGVNNNNNSSSTSNAGQKNTCRTQFPNIKSEDGSRSGFEHRLGRQTYSRTEMLFKLQRRKKTKVTQGSSSGSVVDVGGGISQDLPVINTKEASPCAACSCGAGYVANGKSDSGCHSKDSSVARSHASSHKSRRVTSTSSVSKVPHQSRDPEVTDAPNSAGDNWDFHRPSGHGEDSNRGTSDQSKRKLGFVEVATPLHKNRDGSPVSEERSASTSSPVVSIDVDSVCEELQKIVLRRSKHDPTCATPFGVRWQEESGESPASDVASDKSRFVRAMQALQPPVPHVVWPENKFYSPNTVFVYASPSRLAPMVIPSHSVDCPQCKLYQASSKGDACPPNSPTPWLQKEYGFYPVERHFGCI